MINRIFELMIVHSILQKLNEMNPRLNNYGVFLPMLFSHEQIHKNVEYRILPVDTTIAGSKLWPLNPFQMDPGVHWVQANQQVSL